MGSVYRRPRSPYLWISYYDARGRQIRESTKSDKLAVARELLKRREGEISEGRMPGVYFDRVTFKELLDDLERDYRLNNRKSMARMNLSCSKLEKHFGNVRATAIDATAIRKYVDTRMAEGAAPASVNRELSALKRALHLGAQDGKVDRSRLPHIEMLKESAPRRGFFEAHEFDALMQHLPGYLKGPMMFAYRTGWRVGELRGLRWSYVDRAKGIVTLPVGTTKNGAGRTLYLDDELKAMIENLWQERKESGRLTPYVFLGQSGIDKIKDFRHAWATACSRAGIGKRLVHDLRRSSIRNMVRAGIPERVVMQISGHKTRSVFDRYNIVSESDLRTAAEKQSAYLGKIRGAASTLTSTLAVFPTKQELAQ